MSSKDEPDLSQQVKFLQDVLQNASVNEDETAAAENLAVLLRQLDEAGDVAQDVEVKLDKLLENLEGMIEELGGNKDSDKPTNGTDGHLNEQTLNKPDSGPQS